MIMILVRFDVFFDSFRMSSFKAHPEKLAGQCEGGASARVHVKRRPLGSACVSTVSKAAGRTGGASNLTKSTQKFCPN